MTTERILASLITVCFILSVTLEFTEEYLTAIYFDFLIVPLITLTYIVLIKNKEILFLMFLVVFSLGDISDFIGFFLSLLGYETTVDLSSLCNTLYIIAYIILIIKISLSLSLKYVIKHLKLHVIVMVLVSIYLLYLLQTLIKENSITNDIMSFQKEFVYNAVTLLLLTISFLNYIYRDSQKSLFLFLGVLALVFCEVFEIAFIYINFSGHFYNYAILISIAKVLSLGAFYLLYQQSKLIEHID